MTMMFIAGAWIIAGSIGALMLEQKGYFKRNIIRDASAGKQDAVAFFVLGGALLLLIALVAPRK